MGIVAGLALPRRRKRMRLPDRYRRRQGEAEGSPFPRLLAALAGELSETAGRGSDSSSRRTRAKRISAFFGIPRLLNIVDGKRVLPL